MDWEKKLRERVDKLTKDRDEFIKVANQEIAVYNGRIAEAKELLESLKAPEETKEG